MYARRRLVAAISISILLVSVLCSPINSVFADSSKGEIQKQEQISEQQAQAYLEQLGIQSHYGQLGTSTTNETGSDRKAELAQAELSVQEQGQQYLQQIAKSHVGEQFNTTSTIESGKNRNAEIAKAKLALQ